MPAQQRTNIARIPARQAYRGRNIAIACFVVLSVIALTIFVIRSGSRPDLMVATHAEQVSAGQQLYATRCASCHGAGLEGGPGWPQPQSNGVMPSSPLDARSPARQHDDAWIFRTIKEGGQATVPAGSSSAMPAMGSGMSDEQIWAVITYIKSTWPK